ncbi:PH domain-containing protein [Kineococcus arenarius]|uniref:PH domain-containing protein n=1 Tax=unclassified Kineococcus TaxID=2621656 RepID=UPI003D7D0E71
MTGTAQALMAIVVPVAFAVFLGGDTGSWLALSGAGLVLLVAAIMGVVSALTTTYRLTPQHLQISRGLLSRSARAVALDRIRSVDVTAKPVHRLLGLATLTIGTGGNYAGVETRPTRLDGLPAPEAEELRRALLPTTAEVSRLAGAEPAASTAATDAPSDAGAGAAREELVRLDWRWLRYAPLSITGLTALWLVVSSLLQTADDLRRSDVGKTWLREAAQWTDGWATWQFLALAMVLVAVVGSVGSLAVFAEGWWGFTLHREPAGSATGTLRSRRGLLTTRSSSLEEARLRGVEFRQPLSLRWAQVASLRAIATGLKRSGDGFGGGPAVLLPPVPLSITQEVARGVLHEVTSPLANVAWQRHPRAALRRRLARAITVPALAAGCVALTGLPSAWWLAVAVLALLTGWVAVDGYASLAHHLRDGYLLVRRGSLVRSSVALQDRAVIGFRISSSPSQRRAGLCTLTATTAAGAGGVKVTDLAAQDALPLARVVVPGLLEQFLDG